MDQTLYGVQTTEQMLKSGGKLLLNGSFLEPLSEYGKEHGWTPQNSKKKSSHPSSSSFSSWILDG